MGYRSGMIHNSGGYVHGFGAGKPIPAGLKANFLNRLLAPENKRFFLILILQVNQVYLIIEEVH